MSDVFEYLGKSGFKISILSSEGIDFDPFFEDSQRHLREAFGYGWVYGVNRNDMVQGLIYRKKNGISRSRVQMRLRRKILKGGKK